MTVYIGGIMKRKPRGLRLQAQAVTHSLRTFLRGVAKVRIFRVKVYGRIKIPRKGPVIVACNHPSNIDPVFVWGVIPRNAVAVAKAELWKVPGLNLILWLLGHIPIKRGDRTSGRKTINAGIRTLQHGGLLMIFPEGGCSATLKETFKPGMAIMSIETDTPILPMAIIGSGKVWPLGSKRIHRKMPVHVRVGEPVHPRDYLAPTMDERIQRLNDAVRAQMVALGAE